MSTTLKSIWKNRAKILEGVRNTILRDELVEDVARMRRNICDECEFLDTKGKECAVKGTQPCCGDCGCSLTFKTRSLSSDCPQGKWEAIATEEEEDKLEEL
tara:strand:+ start:554 stop:856 length:303 start_codon:yes stop_codon:yes gene_type:complete